MRVQIVVPRQIPGILHETGWESFTEQRRIDREDKLEFSFAFTLAFFFLFGSILFLYYILCRVSAQHFTYKFGGAFLFHFISLCALLLYLVPCC